MNHPELPPDLSALEADLAGRTLPDAPPGLRDRILAVAERAQAERLASRRSWATFLGGLAAAFLVAANLALGAVNATTFLKARARGQVGTAALAQQIQEAVPELSAEEARCRAVLHQAGSRLGPPVLLLRGQNLAAHLDQ